MRQEWSRPAGDALTQFQLPAVGEQGQRGGNVAHIEQVDLGKVLEHVMNSFQGRAVK
jgi:hypothetical protein